MYHSIVTHFSSWQHFCYFLHFKTSLDSIIWLVIYFVCTSFHRIICWSIPIASSLFSWCLFWITIWCSTSKCSHFPMRLFCLLDVIFNPVHLKINRQIRFRTQHHFLNCYNQRLLVVVPQMLLRAWDHDLRHNRHESSTATDTKTTIMIRHLIFVDVDSNLIKFN